MLTELMDIVIKAICKDMLTKENLQKYGDRLFDLIEDFVADTATRWDDRTVLPVVRKIREVVDIPDNDEPMIEE